MVSSWQHGTYRVAWYGLFQPGHFKFCGSAVLSRWNQTEVELNLDSPQFRRHFVPQHVVVLASVCTSFNFTLRDEHLVTACHNLVVLGCTYHVNPCHAITAKRSQLGMLGLARQDVARSTGFPEQFFE
jgi:hypothetical protein